MNLVHRLLALEFAIAFRAFDAMFCVVVLSSCQQVTAEQMAINLIHRLLSPEFTIARRALHRAMG